MSWRPLSSQEDAHVNARSQDVDLIIVKKWSRQTSRTSSETFLNLTSHRISRTQRPSHYRPSSAKWGLCGEELSFFNTTTMTSGVKRHQDFNPAAAHNSLYVAKHNGLLRRSGRRRVGSQRNRIVPWRGGTQCLWSKCTGISVNKIQFERSELLLL